jgi:carboxymethylenebutenolidase
VAWYGRLVGKADYRPSYRKNPAEDGWKRMPAWFKKNGAA